MSTINKPSIRRAYHKKQQSLTNNTIENEKEKKGNFGFTRGKIKRVIKKIMNYLI